MSITMAPLHPSVSVILPTHDRVQDLERAIATVVEQTLGDWELLIVDDGSDPAVVLEPRWAADTRIRLIRLNRCGGVAAARNIGIAHARGTWLAFLDDDDLWAPDKLDQQTEVLGRTQGDFAYTGVVMVTPTGNVRSVNRAPSPDDLFEALHETNVIWGPSSVMVRRDVLRDVGNFSERLSVLADWDLYLRLAERRRAVAVDDVLTAVIHHPGSMQLTQAHQVGAELRVMAELHDAPGFETSHHVLLGLAQKRWQARRTPANTLRYAFAFVRLHRLRAPERLLRRVAFRWATTPEWVAGQLAPAEEETLSGRPLHRLAA